MTTTHEFVYTLPLLDWCTDLSGAPAIDLIKLLPGRVLEDGRREVTFGCSVEISEWTGKLRPATSYPPWTPTVSRDTASVLLFAAGIAE